MRPFDHMDQVAELLADETPKPDRARCPHGVKPWFDCETCQKDFNYNFSGNFR